MKLSIVIPVYNERNTILRILKSIKDVTLPEEITNKEILIIDDFSTDGTRTVLQKLNDKEIMVFYHEKNIGKGAALKTGFKQVSGDIIIIQDADMEYNPHEYPELLTPIIKGTADVVYGSRFLRKETSRFLFFFHSVGNKFLTFVSNIFSNLHLTDIETCYKVFKKEIIDKIEVEEKRFGFEPEFTAKVAGLVKSEKIKVCERGISFTGRSYKEGKKIGFKDAVRSLFCIYLYNTSKRAKIIKYISNSIFIAVSLCLTMFLFVEVFHFKSKLYKNIFYFMSIEFSTILGFIFHLFITLRIKVSSVSTFLLSFLSFHLIILPSFLLRQFLFFYLLEYGIEYNTDVLIGIFLSVLLNLVNFMFFNRTYKKPGKDK